MRCLRTLSLMLLSLAFSALALPAQTAAIQPRVNGPIDNNQKIELRGNVPARAQPQFDRGPASASLQLGRMRLVLSRSAPQEAALDTYLEELQEKSSPNYHKWLTPEQLGKLYGPADSDIAAIVAWLQSRGLTVGAIPPARTTIAFSGTVRQVEDAFSTRIHSFEADGEQFTANTVNPRIPAGLSSVVGGVSGLSTLHPRAHSIAGKQGTYDSSHGRFVAVEQQQGRGPRADLTTGTSPNFTLYIVPGDASTIYDTPNTTLNANYTTGTNYTGSGVTIGVGGDSAILQSTVASYRTRFLGNSTAPTVTYCDSTVATVTCSTDAASNHVTANGNIEEAYIDNELSGGMAPGATIHYYASADLYSALEQALTDNTVDIFSLSFGLCEYFLTTSDNAFLNDLWQQAAGQGIAVTVSTGDAGSAVCDNPNSELTAQYGLQVSGFSTTPYNVAVGGTDLSGLLTSFSTYVGTTSTTDGTAATLYRSATKYIPEATWNDSVETDGLLANNIAFVDAASGNTNIVGGSGGASRCTTNTTTATTLGTCTSGYTKPTWQRGTGVPPDGVRDVPDISLMAGDGADAAAWLICTDDTGTVGGITVSANCTTQSNSQFYFFGFGGTSTAAPAFAGMLAMVQEKAGGRLGQATKELYDLYNGPNKAVIFHDITTGNISVPCTAATPNCQANSKSANFETKYDTTTGYDLATGMGSVDAANLVKYWGTATGATAATISITPSLTTLTPQQALTVAVTVTGIAGTPTGTVTLTSGTYATSASNLAAGAHTFSIPAGTFFPGAHTLSVAYSGDVDYSSGTKTAVITVIGLPATVSAVPAATSINSGQTLAVAVTVGGTGATPTGTVTLSGGGYTSAAQALVSGAATITVPANKLSAGSDTLTVTYSGDAVYSTKGGTTAVTVTASVYTLAAAAPAAISKGGTGSSTVTVASTTGYSGTVTLSCKLTTSPAGATDLPTCAAPSAGVALTAAATSVTGNVTVSTTAAQALLHRPLGGWEGVGGGAVLALIAFFGIPARRRNWRAMLGALVLLMTLGSLAACGGGGGSGGTKDPGTSSGTYTFTVTGTGSPAVTPAPTTTFTLTVN